MSTFGALLFHGPHLIEVGPVTLRAGKKQLRALLRFEQVGYEGLKSMRWPEMSPVETRRITIDYNSHLDDQNTPHHWNQLVALGADEVRAYGPNTLGFDNVRVVMEPKDRAAVAVWLDEVLGRTPENHGKFYIEVGWPKYGSRDEILGTDWYREPEEYGSVAAAWQALKKRSIRSDPEASSRVVTAAGAEVHERHISLPDPVTSNPDDDMFLFGLSGLSNFINSHRKYYLTGDVWQGKNIVQSNTRLTLERFDESHDSAFLLYFRDGGFVGRISPATVAKNTKWVKIQRAAQHYRVQVLRAELLSALEALA